VDVITQRSWAGIDQLLRNIWVSGALLDGRGTIVEVSDGWKRFADDAGLKLKRYGIGQDYLKHCLFGDVQSVHIIGGLKQVLAGEIDFFGTLYPCDTPERARLFMMVAFGVSGVPGATVVLHLDLSEHFQGKSNPSAALFGLGAAATQQVHEDIKKTVRRSILEAFAERAQRGAAAPDIANVAEQKKLNALTSRQMEVLAQLGIGATNAEIAERCSLSLDATKTQAAAIVRKLGLRNRTEAALFAARNGIVAAHRQSPST
jgi:DNA-binding CsgD family transcriptional regulator